MEGEHCLEEEHQGHWQCCGYQLTVLHLLADLKASGNCLVSFQSK